MAECETRKIAYENESAARAVLKQIQLRPRQGRAHSATRRRKTPMLGAYLCPCGSWHLGTQIPRR